MAAHAACKEEALTRNCERRAREERTLNILYMFVTPDVSKLTSGWLNLTAPCRVEGRACMRRGARCARAGECGSYRA